MNQMKFHARTLCSDVRIQADSPAMKNMLAAVLQPYFCITEDAAPLTVLCPEDGKLPALPGRGKYLVVCNAKFQQKDRIIVLPRPLDLEQFLNAALDLSGAESVIVPQDYQCDDTKRTLTYGGRTVSLTEKEYALFRLLHAHIGEVVAKETLTRLLWKEGNNNACQVYVAYLRGKLEQIAGSGALTSVRGRGYILRRPSENTERKTN